jgi:NADPH:quinone reductase-like Zn-dependent oxidoreductase
MHHTVIDGILPSSLVGNGIFKPGDWVLIYAVGGHTGQWTVQMCKLFRYRVIGTSLQSKAQEGTNVCSELIVLENEDSNPMSVILQLISL